MVAVVTGAVRGLIGNSAMLLGSQGQLGSALLGQAGSRVTVNAAKGNLVIQNQDEMLLGRGPDDVITNTYNSMGNFTANGWQESYQRHVGPPSSTDRNQPLSTITHYAADGSEIVYNYNASYNGVACYVGNESDGAYDTLVYSTSNGGEWTWTDGDSQVTECYDDATGRLKWVKDTDGNTLTYAYDNTTGLLDRITTANGDATHDYTRFYYNGTTSQLLSIESTFWDAASAVKTQTRTSYGYDTYGRLTSVTVDLTPEDTTDSKTYVTTYSYVDTTTNRIASIVQSDGTLMDIAYNGNLVTSVTQTVASGVTTVTSFRYGSGWTTVTDPQGNSTTMVYDSAGRLTRLISPPAVTGGPPQLRSFTYDANGNLLYSALLPNSLVGDANFTNYTTTWNDLTITPSVATTQSTELDGSVTAYRRMTNATAASGTVMSLGQGTALSSYNTVTPGQNVQFSAYTATAGAGSVRLNAVWYSSSGTELSRTVVTGTRGGSIWAGGLANANFVSGSATVPAGAAYVELMVDATADGTGVLNVAIARPTLVILGGAQAPATTYTYDGNGNVLSMTDALGQQTLYTYDSKNQVLTRTVYADATTPQTTRYVYDSKCHLVYTISPHATAGRGGVTRYIYDSVGQLSWTVQYAGPLYDISGLASNVAPTLSTMTAWIAAAPASDVSNTIRTVFTYDQRGALVSTKTYGQIVADGTATGSAVTNYVYDQAGRLTSHAFGDMSGAETYTYDGLGRIVKFTAFNGKDTTTTYLDDGTQHTTTVVMADSTIKTSVYDRAGELVSYAVSGNGVATTMQYTYDSNGQLIRTKDVTTGLSNFVVWDELGRKAADVTPDGSVTAYIYNTYDQLVRTIAYANRLTTTQLNLLKNATTSSASITLSQVTPTASAANDRWNWSIYDVDGRLVQTIDGLGNVVAFAYDKADRLIKTTAYATQLAAATVTGYQTTPPVTPVTVTTDSAKDRVTRTFYDGSGHLVAVLDAEGYLTQTKYDGAGQKIETIAFYNATAATNRASGSLDQLLTDVSTNTQDIHNYYFYDNSGRLGATVDGEGYVTRYESYTSAGYVGKVTRGGPAVTVSATTTLANLPAASGTLEVINYTYDHYGHVKTKKLNLANSVTETTTYNYDDVYNLTSQTTVSKSGADTSITNNRTATFLYDGLGRKVKELSGVGSAALALATTQAEKDQVWADFATTYAYDSLGHLISRTEPKGVVDGKGNPDAGAGSDRTVFYYDNDGRLTYQIDAVGGVTQYSYNNLGEKTDVRVYANKMSNISSLAGGLDSSLTGLPAIDNLRDSVSHVSYDVDGNVTQATVSVRNKDSDTSSTTEAVDYAYNAFNEVKTRTDFLGVVNSVNTTTQTAMAYNRRGQLLSSTADATGLALMTQYSYDAFGRVIGTIDASLTARSTTYYRDGHVKSQIDGLIHTAAYTYDAFGHVASLTDKTGAVTNYSYDAFDRYVTMTDPNNVVTATTNDAYGKAVKIVDGHDSSVTNVYDADGNITSQTDGNNNVTRYVYDKAGRVAFVIDRAGGVTGYGYDREDHVVETVKYFYVYTTTGPRTLDNMIAWAATSAVTNAGNLKTSATYDGAGRMLTSTDANGVVTAYSYDPSGRKLKEVVDPTGLALTTTWEYNGDYSVKVTSPAGRVVLSTYDAVGRLAEKAVDPSGLNLKTTYGYDADGNVLAVTDPEGKITRNVYDADNRLIYSIDPNGIVTGYSYDNEDRLIQTARFATTYTATGTPVLATLQGLSLSTATVSRTVYDAGGRVLYTIDPMGEVTLYDYTGNDRQATKTTRFVPTYTAIGVPVLATLQALDVTNAIVTRAVYDAGGRLSYSITPIETKDANGAPTVGGVVTGYKYDGEGRLIQTTRYSTLTSVAPDVAALDALGTTTDLVTRIVYDATGRVTFSIDETLAVTGFKYDNDGRVVQTNRFATFYTPATPNLATMDGAVNDNDVVTRTVYDAAGRTVYSIDAAGVVQAYQYDGDGLVTRSIRYLNVFTATGPQTLTYVRDTWLPTKANAAYDLRSYSYYDNAGRLVCSLSPVADRTGCNTGSVTAYTYDKNGRVIKTLRYATEVTVTYATDPALPTVTTNAADLWTRYTYDAGGRVAYTIGSVAGTAETIDDAVTAYSYDTNGRVTQTVQYYNRYVPTDTPDAATMATWVGNNGGADGGANDLVTRTLYDKDGRLNYMIDATGSVTKYNYDTFNRLVRETRYAVAYAVPGVQALTTMGTWTTNNATGSRATNYTYRLDGTLNYSINAASYRTNYSYDNFGHVLQTQFYLTTNQTEKLYTRHTYDVYGREIYAIDAAGSVTRYQQYDAQGRAVYVVQYAKASAFTAVQNEANMNSWVGTNADAVNDRVTRSLYNDDRLTWTVAGLAGNADGGGAVTYYHYNFLGLVDKTIQYANRYQGTGTLTLTGMPGVTVDTTKDHTTTYGYDNDGNQTVVIDPTTTQTRTWYDAFGRKYRTDVAYGVASDTVRTNWSYGTDGLVTQTAAYAAGNDTAVTKSTYNALGRMINSIDGNGNTTLYEYDKDGRTTKTTVPTGASGSSLTAVTSREYNVFGELVKLTDPNLNVGYFYYDVLGRQTFAVDAIGYATQTVYTIDGGIKSVKRYATAVDLTNISTGTPPATVANDTYNLTSFTRDGDGRVLTTTDGENNTTTYAYDGLGNRIKTTNAALAVVDYTYYTNGLLKTQKQAETKIGTVQIAPETTTYYEYDAFGNRTKMVEAQGKTEQRTTNYEYYLDNRLKKQTGDTVTVTYSDGTTASVTPTQDFVYDKRGNLISAKDAAGGITYTYYDKMDRKALQVYALGYAIAWTYDDNGNALTQKAYDAKVTVNSTDLTVVPVPAGTFRETDFTYDKENRLLSTTVKAVATGRWDPDANSGAGAWTTGGADLTTGSTTYDANGNVRTQTDGNGKVTYSYYDKLGRKVAQVDQDNFLTTFKYDSEGNVLEQVQYAKALTGTYATWTNPPATPAADANDADRKTTFVYDHNGHVTSQTRVGGSYWAVSDGTGVPSGGTNGLPAGGMTNLTGDLVVAFTYNNLGLVSRRTEANGDYTDYVYDGLGRVARVTTGNAGAGNTDTGNVMTTQTTYNGLGDMATTIAGYGGTVEEKTTYTYGIGGRLLSRTDAENYVVSYGYDANGRQTLESYVRNGLTEGTLTTYDALGQVTRTARATQSGSTWTVGDTTNDTFYDAFSEVIARGTNTGSTPDITKAQEFADYDAAGRMWRSNMNDGITKVFAYDGNGNATMQVVSQGATNLATAADLTAALGLTGTIKTYNIYDNRNELTDVRRPTSVNLDNTVSSGGNLTVGAAGAVIVTQTNAGAAVGSNTVATIKVALSSAVMTTHNGTGKIHVLVTATDGQSQTLDFDSGQIDLGTYTFNFMTTTPGLNGPYKPHLSVKVTQSVTGGPDIVLWDPLGHDSYGFPAEMEAVCYYSAQFTNTKVMAAGVGLVLQGLDTATSSVKAYVRPYGSTGNYTEAPVTSIYDAAHNVVPGSYGIDPYVAPFNGTLGTSWEVKYVARDASNNILDAKVAKVSSGASLPLSVTLDSLAATQVFTAAVQGDGSFVLTATTLASAYSDTFQTYNAFGDIKSQTDANGNLTTFTYDVMGNLTSKSSAKVGIMGEDGKLKEDANHNTALSIVESYRYDQSGRLVGRVDGNGFITSQRLLAGTGYNKTDALITDLYNPIVNDIVRTRYDAFNNVIKQIDAGNYETNYVFDKDNRLVTVKHAVRADSSQLLDFYTYDILGQRTTHTNNVFATWNGGSQTWVPTYSETTTYDLQGRVTQTVSFGGQVTGYNYAWAAATSTGFSTLNQENSGAWTRTTTAWSKSSSATTNLFGRLVASVDFGNHSTNYDYNFAALISHQDSTAGQNINYLYTTSGLLASVTDMTLSNKSVYAYDSYGNRTVEAYYHSGNAPDFYQAATIRYDAMNRVSRFIDSEGDITYAYDANSNRRRIKSAYAILSPYYYSTPGVQTTVNDYWYTYDKANRVLIAKGTLSGTNIVASSESVVLSYNTRGDRTQADYGTGTTAHSEYYSYGADGYLETIRIKEPADSASKLRVSRTNDLLGRMTAQYEYKNDGTATVNGSPTQTRLITYDRDNRITDESDTSYTLEWISGEMKGVITTSVVHNDYRIKVGSDWTTGTDIGVATHTKTTQTRQVTGDSAINQDSDAVMDYVWWSGAKSLKTTVTATTVGVTDYTYDVNGVVSQVYDVGGKRKVKYQNDVFGQVVTRQEYTGTNLDVIGARRSFFYLNGRQIGDAGTDQLASEIDYAQQLAKDDGKAVGSWYGSYGTEIVGTNGHTDTYEAYNNTSVDQAGSSYTANAGDTLQSVAMSIWGDSTLWYLLAEANGLGAGTTLAAGQILVIPGKSTNAFNGASNYKAYDPADALGNTNPTQPQPPKPKQHGCGVLGTVLAIVVAAVVVYFTRRLDIGAKILTGALKVAAPFVDGAITFGASDAAYQATQIAVGNQSKFNWKELGSAALSGGIANQMNLVKKATTFLDGFIQGLKNNLVRQGVNMALGIQKKFDWTGLAVAGVTAGVSAKVSNWLDGNGKTTDGTGGADTTHEGTHTGSNGSGHSKIDAFGAGVIETTVSSFAGAAVRSALTGQKFDKSLREVWPDAIMQTIGNLIGDQIGGAIDDALHPQAPVDAKTLSQGGAVGHTHADQQAPASSADIVANQGNTSGYSVPSDWDFGIDLNTMFKVNFNKYSGLNDLNLSISSGGNADQIVNPDSYVEVIGTRRKYTLKYGTWQNLTYERTFTDNEIIYNDRPSGIMTVSSKNENLISYDLKNANGSVVTRFMSGDTILADIDPAATPFSELPDGTRIAYQSLPYSVDGNALEMQSGYNALTTMYKGQLYYKDDNITLVTVNYGHNFNDDANNEQLSKAERNKWTWWDIRHLKLAGEQQSYEQEDGNHFGNLVAKRVSNATVVRDNQEIAQNRERINGFNPFENVMNKTVAPAINRTVVEPVKTHVVKPVVDYFKAHPKDLVRAQGVVQLFGAGVQGTVGVTMTIGGSATAETGVGAAAAVVGVAVTGRAFDNGQAAARQIWTGEYTDTVTYEALTGIGFKPATARFLEIGADLALDGGAARLARGMTVPELGIRANLPKSPVLDGMRTVFKPGGCFVAGTMIHTRNGLSPIEEIRVGDYALSQPEVTGERAYRQVTETFVYDDKSILEVGFVSASGRTESVFSTFEHPFWVTGIGWTAANLLEVGQTVELQDGTAAHIISVKDTGGEQRVYNFTVDGFHTYYVGKLGVWVHNIDICDPTNLIPHGREHLPEILVKSRSPQPTGSFAGKVTISNGRVLLDGVPAEGWHDFVVTSEGRLNVGKGHYFLSGEAETVGGAGEAYFKNGKFDFINDASGHYLPTADEVKRTYFVLRNNGLGSDIFIPGVR